MCSVLNSSRIQDHIQRRIWNLLSRHSLLSSNISWPTPTVKVRTLFYPVVPTGGNLHRSFCTRGLSGLAAHKGTCIDTNKHKLPYFANKRKFNIHQWRNVSFAVSTSFANGQADGNDHTEQSVLVVSGSLS